MWYDSGILRQSFQEIKPLKILFHNENFCNDFCLLKPLDSSGLVL